MDLWAIDAYPIDWINTPNNDPDNRAYYPAKNDFFMHWEIAVQQLQELRAYLDNFPQYVDTPIWITEIAVHVAFGFGQDPHDGWQWVLKTSGEPCDNQQVLDGKCKLASVGEPHWDLMSNYLNSVLDWLDANASSLKIERWFFFITWQDIVNVEEDGYMGIVFFDGPQQGASLNCLGEVYRAQSLGLPRVDCDADRNVVTPTPTPTP